jgi:hypothetical protein
MSRKSIGILVILVFVIVSWYVYGLYPYVQNLVFALLVSVMSVVSIIFYYKATELDSESFKNDKSMDRIRVIFTAIAMLMFLGFFALNMKYGGSATSASDAMSRYENYVDGAYYLSSHGNFTEVSYDVWRLMRTVELIVLPSFVIMFVWNFAHGVKTKGWKYMLSGREKDSK